MRRVVALATVLAAGMMFASGCGGGSKSATTAQLRVANAVADSAGTGGLDVLADTSTFATALGFGTATPYTSVASGAHTIEVRNTGTTADLLSQSINVTGGSSQTLVLGGPGATPGTIQVTDTTTQAATGKIEVRVINATAAFGAMDVYIVPYGTSLYSVTANVSGLQPGSGSGYQTLTTGNYDILITKPGDKTQVFLETGTITFADTAVITIIIQGPSNPGGLPLSFQQLTDAAGKTS